MKIVTLSDTHGKHKQLQIPNGDMIIHAGDCTKNGHELQAKEFLEWYGDLPHKHKILIAGNHDWFFENNLDFPNDSTTTYNNIIYLNDSTIEIDGIKIWGSPVQPAFCDWAFNRSRTEEESQGVKKVIRNNLFNLYPYIGNHWNKIPLDVDILVTHTPPYGIFDKTQIGNQHVGCKVLANKIAQLNNLKLHIFGHIHESKGMQTVKHSRHITYINTASLDLNYIPRKQSCYILDWKKI